MTERRMTRVMRAERYMVVVMRGRKVCVGKAKIWGGAVPPSCVASLGRSRGRAAEETVPCICWKKSRGLRTDDGWMGEDE